MKVRMGMMALAVYLKTAFGVFLIANALAFGHSTNSVFLHFSASATIKDDIFHRKVARRISFFTNWSIRALLVAFIASTYTVWSHTPCTTTMSFFNVILSTVTKILLIKAFSFDICIQPLKNSYIYIYIYIFYS